MLYRITSVTPIWNGRVPVFTVTTVIQCYWIVTIKLGVTSIVRALGLDGAYYDNLRDNLHSTGIKLDTLSATWTKAVLRVFPGLVRVNGRLVLVGDGIKVGKQGRKMPGVKLLHQQSKSNTKAESIMGHSLQAVSILAPAAQSFFAIPLAASS
jgi:hypothetical protein